MNYVKSVCSMDSRLVNGYLIVSVESSEVMEALYPIHITVPLTRQKNNTKRFDVVFLFRAFFGFPPIFTVIVIHSHPK